MDALVLQLGDELKVAELVVELVSVSVVDVVSSRDGSVGLLPDVDVLHDVASSDLEASVSLGSDGSWHGFIVSQLHDFAQYTGRSDFGALAT